MSEEFNPVIDWINTDEKLRAIIERLSNSGLTEKEQADVAFDEISDAYNLLKYPDSFTENDYKRYEELGINDPRSVYEEVGIIHYLEPNDDPRGIVLFAIHNIKNNLKMDINEAALKHFKSKKKIPSEYMIYFLGDKSSTMMYFLENDKSWSETGAKYASKIINL
jgi:hypothetical protein